MSRNRLRCLRGSSALQALENYPELAPDLRAVYGQSGATYASAGLPLVAMVGQDPILGTEDVYIPLCDGRLVRTAPARRDLLDAATERWRADRIILRVPANGLDAPEELHPLAYYFTKKAEARSFVPTVKIREVDKDSVGFVHSLLQKALVSGYESVVPAEAIEAYVTNSFRFSPDDRSMALVAHSGSEPIGHITWLEDVRDDVTNRSVIEIVDSYVLDAYEGQGISRELTATLENRMASEERLLRGNVLPAGDRSHLRIMVALTAGGWTRDFDLWVYSPHEDQGVRSRF